MPARSVDEINITNFVNTGLTTAIPRYTFNLEIKYTDLQGVKRTYSATHTYPNDLTPMPLRVRRRFAEDQIKAVARVAAGIDTWEDYE